MGQKYESARKVKHKFFLFLFLSNIMPHHNGKTVHFLFQVSSENCFPIDLRNLKILLLTVRVDMCNETNLKKLMRPISLLTQDIPNVTHCSAHYCPSTAVKQALTENTAETVNLILQKPYHHHILILDTSVWGTLTCLSPLFI